MAANVSPAPSPAGSAPAALDVPVYVVADAHLGVAPPEQEALLWSFLDHVAGRQGTVVMNGDMFEFWFEWGHVTPHVGVRLLAACATLAERGRPVLWIKGNHDCWGGDVLRSQSGAAYLDGPWTGSLAGWRTLVDHGDGLRPELDRGYRALRTVIRHPWSVRAFRWLHPDWGAALARATSHTSRNVRPRDGGEGLRAVAHQALAADSSLEAVVYGHTHIAMLERKSRETGIYANPGAWMNEPTFLKFTPESVSLCRWNGRDELPQVTLDRMTR
ncbi:MAG: UDP-2,3-diacylglucosamine diphosphatase [Gemmatimonadetes bacterium]|nr:UDP-2,3-diacylglucosamine diphosphatase [Gemmatimonadota bacterium]